MSAGAEIRRKRTYSLRPWGRPLGVLAGCLVAALTFGPLDAFLGQGAPFLKGLGLTVLVTAAFKYLAENAVYVVAQTVLVWWWLTFVKYRSRKAFAFTGLVLAAYPVALIIGRNLAFGPAQGKDVFLVVGAIILAFAAAGALSMLALHVVAHRRSDLGSHSIG